MSADPIIALNASLHPAIPRRRSIDRAVLADYWALTKPEVNFLILITTLAVFYVALEQAFTTSSLVLVIHTLLGTLFVASGAATLNQYVERDFDAQMRRTSRRPLAAGRIKPRSVLWFG